MFNIACLDAPRMLIDQADPELAEKTYLYMERAVLHSPFFYYTSRKFFYSKDALEFYEAFEDIDNMNIPKMAVKAMKLSA